MQTDIHQKLQWQKQDTSSFSRLQSLQNNLVGGIFQQKKRKELEEKAKKFLQNALFLQKDQKRKRRWIASLSSIRIELLEKLPDMIFRENMRYQKRERDLVVELNKKNPQALRV